MQYNPNQPQQSSYPPTAPTQPSYPPHQPLTKPYSRRVLFVLTGLYAFFWLLCIIGQNATTAFDLGIALCVGIAVSVLILDARGFISLQARIKPSFLIGVLCFFLVPLWLGAYLVSTFLSYRRPPLSLASPRRKATISFSVGAVVTLIVFVFSAAASTATPVVATPGATSVQVGSQATLVQPTLPQAKPTQQQATKSLPTQVPQITSKPTQPPQPTQPTKPPHQTTYDFNPNGGSLVYNPPADWCATHGCVSTFWTATNGYVVQCVNGLYSHSGGVRGVCSRDGGPANTLYMH